MKNNIIRVFLLVFIYGALASALGWVVTDNKISQPKVKEVLIDSLKIGDSLTIKVYRKY